MEELEGKGKEKKVRIWGHGNEMGFCVAFLIKKKG
jgi:hypothetical protein